MWKVTLINTYPATDYSIKHLPLSLAYVSSVLKEANFVVSAFDMAVDRKPIDDIVNDVTWSLLIVINSENSVLQTRDFSNALKIASQLKEMLPSTYIALTWAHVTFRDKETLANNAYVDFCIRFEPEYTVKELAIALQEWRDLSNVLWISYRDLNWNIIRNSDCKYVDLDQLPLPDRNIFPIEKYLLKDKETTLQTTRWCTHRCLYCQSSSYDRIFRIRKDIKSIVDEFFDIFDLWFESVFFSDLDFWVSFDRVMNICKEISSRNRYSRWSCNIRADHLVVDNVDELLSAMKTAWCYRVFVGFESSSDKTLDLINKRSTSLIWIKASENLKKHGINIHASFLFGLPGDTVDTIKSTVKYAKMIDPQMVSFNLLTPFPGTDIWDNPEKYWIILKDPKWYEKNQNEIWQVCWNDNITPDELINLSKWAYENFLSE